MGSWMALAESNKVLFNLSGIKLEIKWSLWNVSSSKFAAFHWDMLIAASPYKIAFQYRVAHFKIPQWATGRKQQEKWRKVEQTEALIEVYVTWRWGEKWCHAHSGLFSHQKTWQTIISTTNLKVNAPKISQNLPGLGQYHIDVISLISQEHYGDRKNLLKVIKRYKI